jgi:chitinase
MIVSLRDRSKLLHRRRTATKAYAALLLYWSFCATDFCVAGEVIDATPQPAHYRVVGYLAGWASPPLIHPEKLTHINFAFARFGLDGHVALADTRMEANLLRLRALKKTNPRLKLIISIGGWQAEGFSDAALTDTSRAAFADSAVEFVRQYSLDGVDIDWEYPGQGVAGIKYRAEDRHNFSLLLQALRDKLDLASAADGRIRENRYSLSVASRGSRIF